MGEYEYEKKQKKVFIALLVLILCNIKYVQVNAENTEEKHEIISDFDMIENVLSNVPCYDVSEGSEQLIGALPTTDEYAVKYDPRKLNMVTEIENQGGYGTCWAHAIVACTESSMLKQGFYDNTLNISELSFAKSIYDNLDDRERTMSFEEFLMPGYDLHSSILCMRDTGEPLYLESPAGDSYLTNEGIAGYINRAYYSKEKHDTQQGINQIKKLVSEYGGVTFQMYMPDGNEKILLSSKEFAVNCNIYKESNHAMEIVGWDDNFARTSFKDIPSGNGAWLVKNSWGMYTGYDFKNNQILNGNGYYWCCAPLSLTYN